MLCLWPRRPDKGSIFQIEFFQARFRNKSWTRWWWPPQSWHITHSQDQRSGMAFLTDGRPWFHSHGRFNANLRLLIRRSFGPFIWPRGHSPNGNHFLFTDVFVTGSGSGSGHVDPNCHVYCGRWKLDIAYEKISFCSHVETGNGLVWPA